jgi:hypothetical protein
MILRKLRWQGGWVRYFLPARCNDSWKNARWLPFHNAPEYARGVEDLSKTESGLERLILQDRARGIHSKLEKEHVRTSP